MKRIGIDYRPVIAAPYSGISRQVLAMEHVISKRSDSDLLRFSPCSLDNAMRSRLITPIKASSESILHRPDERLRFEASFIPKKIKELGIHLYIATANQGLPIWRKPKNIKCVLLLHDLFQITLKEDGHRSKLKRFIYRSLDSILIRLSIRQADAIWTPSEYTKAEAIKLFPNIASKLQVLPNFVAAPNFDIKPRHEYALPERYWLLVGTREPRKNVAWFLVVWLKARNNSSEIPDLVILGSRDEVPSEFKELDGIHFVQNIDDSTLQAIYTFTELLWQPSYAEGFGLPVIEALSLSTPVATAYGSSLDEITPEFSPRFDPYDSDGLYTLMQDLARKPIVKDHKFKQWADRFAMPAYSQRLNSLLDNVLP